MLLVLMAIMFTTVGDGITAEIIRNYVEKQGTKEEKDAIQANEFAGIRITLNDANMPRF